MWAAAAMSTPPVTRRPLGITIVVLLTAAVAVLDLVVGVLLLAGVDDLGAVAGMTADETATSARVVGGVFLFFGLVQAVVAYQLARASNGARLVLTVILLAQQLHSLYLGAQLDIQRVSGFAGLAVAVVILVLVWNPASSRWFDRRRDHALADAIDTEGPERQPSGTRVIDFIVRLIVLGLTIWLMPGVTTDSPGSLILAVVMVSLAGWLLQPLFMRVAVLFGWIGAVFLALFANAVVLGLGLWLTPGVDVTGPVVAFFAAWVYAFVMTLITWAFSINSRDYLTVHAMRMGARGPKEAASDIPGVVFIQLDGVPAPLLENEIRSGNIPTISRWVRSGSPHLDRVDRTGALDHAGEPGRVCCTATTTASPRSGGTTARWAGCSWPTVPRTPRSSRRGVANGRGLLADDGVSISNLFSGDAATSLLTMSGLPGAAAGSARRSVRRVLHPPGGLPARGHPHHRRDGQGGVPGAAPGPPRGRAADRPRRFLRRPAGGDQRLPARPQRGARRRGDDEGLEVDLRRLRRLRRDRPPRRCDPLGVARGVLRAGRRGAQHRAGHRGRHHATAVPRGARSPTTARARVRRSCSATGSRWRA